MAKQVDQEFLSMYVDPELKAWVRVEAAREGKSMSRYVIDMLDRARRRSIAKQRRADEV